MNRTVRRRMRVAWLAVALAGAGLADAGFAGAIGDAWDWPLPPRRFGKLSQTERLQYGRAEDLFRQKNYEAAAIEFEKYAVQQPDSPVRSHCLLMRAYGLHLARQRNAAISLYQELLDFHGEFADDAVPAMYLMATAQFENGNVEAGIKTLRDLAANEKYLAHPVADVALNRLAEYQSGANDEKGAEASWQKVIQNYAGAFMRPDGAAKEARSKLTDLYIRRQRFAAIDELLKTEEAEPAKRVEKLVYVYDRGLAQVDGMDASGKESLLKWFIGRRTMFAEAGKTEDFLNRCLLLAFRVGAKDTWKEFAREAIQASRTALVESRSALAWSVAERLTESANAGWAVADSWKAFTMAVLEGAKGLPNDQQISLYTGLMDRIRSKVDPVSPAGELWASLTARLIGLYKLLPDGDRDTAVASLVDRLRRPEAIQRAYEVAAMIESVPLAKWKAIELLGFEQKFAAQAKACEELEAMDNADLSMRALRTRAGLYRDRLARYEDAIRLFNQINDPPGTSWSIVDCYERWNKPVEAASMCTEIENFFERDAPAASLRKARIWDRAGDRKKAIAECRATIKKYPRHQVSSEAHQMLERYGVKTGGGVAEGED